MQNHSSRAPGAPVLQRRRLIQALETLPARKLALITAPGGYGKTTLVRDFAGRLPGTAFCWLTLDPADASLPMFLQQLAQAVAKHLPPGGLFSMTPDRAPSDPGAVRHLGRLVAAELAQHAEERLVIVLDDLHHIDGGDQVMLFLDALLQYLPESVHLIMATRWRPALPLARLQARGELILLTGRDLSFTEEEVRAFFAERLGLSLPSAVLRLLMNQTEGWVAALQLLGQLLQPLPPEEWEALLHRSPGGGALFDYLAQEVFALQPPEVQEFLLGTCVLDTLQPVIIERMLGIRGAGALLQELEAHNLFVVPLPESHGSYRYHHLFQAFLRQQLLARRGELELNRLHGLAGSVYEGLGNLQEAVVQYLAGQEFHRAAPLMAEQVDALIKSVRQDVVRGWLARIPADLMDSDADILYMRAQLAGWIAQYDVLPLLYQRCLDGYEQRGDHRGLARALSWVCNRFWKLRHPYFHEMPAQWAAHVDPTVRIYGRMLQAFALTSRAEWDRAVAQLEALLREIPPATRAYFDCMETLAVLSFWRGDSARSLLYGIPQCAGRTAMSDFTWGLYTWLSFCFSGDPIGLEMYQRQYMAQEIPANMARMHQLIGTLGEGLVHLYHRRWEDALARFESLQPYFNDNRTGFRALGSEATCIALQEMATLYARLGRREEARAALQRNVDLALGYPEVAAFSFAYMAEFLAAEGDLTGARACLNRANAALAPGLDGIPNIAVGIVACKMALAEGDLPAAREYLAKVLLLVRERSCTWYLLYKGLPEILPVLVDLVRNGLPDGQPGTLVFQVLGAMGNQAPAFLAPYAAHANRAYKEAAEVLLDRLEHGAGFERVPAVKVYGLGPLRVYRYDQPVDSPDWKRTKVKLLLIILLLRRGKPIAKETLTDMLWPDAPPSTARNNLRATLHGLKRTLEPDLEAGADSRYITGDRDTLALGNLGEIWFDYWEFEEHIAKAKSALKRGCQDAAIQLLEAACDLARGSFLPEPIFADFFQDLRSRMEQTYISACLEVARHRLDGREYRSAIDYGRRILLLDPSAEEGYQVLIQAYLGLGERERAMQAYKTCRKHMRQMLGAEPSGETFKLLQA